MKKNIELLMAKRFAELTVVNLDAVMKDDSLTDKEFNSIREAHDSIASARDTIVRLTKPQRMVSAEAKENGYDESEDEKIRKKLIHLVNKSNEYGGYALHKWEADEMLAWLEKQGENPICKVKIGEKYKCIASPRYSCFFIGDVYEVTDDFIAKLINLCSDCFVLLEEQGTSYTKRDVDDAYVEGMAFAKNELEKQGEQKSAWSKMDEEILSNAIFFIREYQTPTRNKTMLSVAKEAEDWLKSLEQRHNWKPTSAQMKALDSAIDEFDGYPEFGSLVSLKKDLEKLKGE